LNEKPGSSPRKSLLAGIAVGALTLFVASAPALAAEDRLIESYSLTVGVADRNHGHEPVENAYVTRLGVRGPIFSAETASSWNWRGFWEVEAGYWRWDDKGPRRQNTDQLGELAIAPVFRLERAADLDSGVRPFVEVAIGVHGISETWISGRDLSSNFHFGSHAGAGWYFGKNDRYELGLHIQHLSNAGIEVPNPGINFVLIKFGIHL